MIWSNYRRRRGRQIGRKTRDCGKRFRNDSQGQCLVESALLAGLLAVAAVTTMSTVGPLAGTVYSKAVPAFASSVD